MAKTAITLTRDDWIEISAALFSKMNYLGRGNYGPCTEHTKRPCRCDAKWIAHLRRIAKIIGPDGETAASRGVASVTHHK